MSEESDSVPVEVRPVRDPKGRPSVLLQLPDAYLVAQPKGAREVGIMLLDAANAVENCPCKPGAPDHVCGEGGYA